MGKREVEQNETFERTKEKRRERDRKDSKKEHREKGERSTHLVQS